MSRGIFNPVFILLLGIQLEAAQVEPPTNVTLDCHNLVQVVKWSYTELSPELHFKIFIGSLDSPPQKFSVDSPNLQAVFSLNTDPADTFSLVVSAEVDTNESDDAPPEGIQFSYNKNSAARKKCFMDLPAVKVTATRDGIAQLSFMHPWLLYGDNMPVKNSTRKKRRSENVEDLYPIFKYEVVIVGKKRTENGECSGEVCDKELSVDPREEKLCLKISGEMEKIAIQGTQEYCTMLVAAQPAEDFKYIIYIVVALLVLIGLAFILFMVYKKLTRPSSPLPVSITEGWKDQLCRAVGVSRDQVSLPVVEPSSPTPLLQTTEFPPPVTSSPEPEERGRIGMLTQGGEGVSDGQEMGNDEGGYTQGGNLDEDDMEINPESSSGYEKRPEV